MNLTDVLMSLGLIFLIVRQILPRPLDLWGLLWPVPLVLYMAYDNLHTLPSGPSLGFALLLGGIGIVLGVLCGSLTLVYRGQKGELLARATGVAVLFWVLGIGARLAFAFAAEHGGGPAIARFSEAHHLTEAAWVAGLLLMSLLEVVGRSGVLLWRRQHAGLVSTG